MKTKKKKSYMVHIRLYADEFDRDTWRQYCRIAGVNPSSKVLSISFSKQKAFGLQEE